MKAEHANANNLQVLAMNTVKILIIMKTKLITTVQPPTLDFIILPCLVEMVDRLCFFELTMKDKGTNSQEIPHRLALDRVAVKALANISRSCAVFICTEIRIMQARVSSRKKAVRTELQIDQGLFLL